MNRFVDILNRIRQNANLSWLTPSQQRAYNLLRERLKFLDEINLWGGRGVGKTFLGWTLWKQEEAVYVPRKEEIGCVQISPLRRFIVVDNVNWRREIVREVLHLCRLQGYDKIILITTEPVQEQMATVELVLTSDDIGRVIDNLRSIGVAPYDDEPRHLWDLVSPLNLKG